MPSVYPAPTTFSGLVANSLRLYRLAPRTLILTFLVLGFFDALLRFGSVVLAESMDADLLELAFGLVVPVVVTVTLGGLGVALGGAVLADRLAGKDTTASEVLASDFPTREVVASGLLASAITLVLAVVLAPIMLLILPMFFGPPIVVLVVALEHERLQPALTRARALTKGSAGRLAGAFFVIALGIGLLQLMLTQIGFGLSESLSDNAQLAIVLAFSIFMQALFYPYIAATGLIAYLDVRARTEDFGADDLRQERN